jgi:hypothetical protein
VLVVYGQFVTAAAQEETVITSVV